MEKETMSMSTGYQRNLETLWPVDGKVLNVNLG